MATQIKIEATVNGPVEKVWKLWSGTEHIVKWNTASPDWHTTKAENDLKVGGKFNSRMEAKDGSFGFDFAGTYDVVDLNKRIAYTMGDGRRASISFSPQGNSTKMDITFDAESENPIEMQKGGWQAILDNFKSYAEKINIAI